MPKSIPANIIRKLYSKNIDSAFLMTLTVFYGDNSVLRLINNEEDIVYNGNTYTATRFTIVLPDDSPDSVPVSTIVFADVNNTFIDIVRNIDELYCNIEMIAVKTNAEAYLYQPFMDSTEVTMDSTLLTMDMTLWPASFNNTSTKRYATERSFEIYETAIGPYEMKLSSASSDIGTTSFIISYDDVGQYTFPNLTFNSYDFPLLY